MLRRGGATIASLLTAALLLSGCAAKEPDRGPRVGRLPAGWDEEAPYKSFLATQPFYVLTQSSSFLLKGSSYGRYVMRVDEPHDGVELFFTSTNANSPNATHPSVKDFEYHYEFMQIRQLGTKVRIMDANARLAFSNANTGKTFTLAYIYGNGANYQYLAPYEGDPAAWRLEPGYYELVIATDQELTIGVNVKLGTPLWSTYYHPQELGSSHDEALASYVEGFAGSPSNLQKDFNKWIRAEEGEIANYFAFSDLIYRSNVASLGAQGNVRVTIDDTAVPQRLEASNVTALGQPQQVEAYAYGVLFNEPGPVLHHVVTELSFQETVSVESDLAAQMLVFGVVLKPERTLAGVPTA